jgi:DNA-binding response OmpR family regulator
MTTEYRVLVVDDDQANRLLIEDMLVPEGFRVFLADSGVSCLEQIALNRPDIVLLDIMMPDMDGFETCREIKDRASSRQIPIVFVSALDERSEAVEGFRVGAADYIVKPFTKTELVARIRKVLDNRKKSVDIANSKVVDKGHLEDVQALLCELSVDLARDLDHLQSSGQANMLRLDQFTRDDQGEPEPIDDKAVKEIRELLDVHSSLYRSFSDRSNERLHELGRIINKLKNILE